MAGESARESARRQRAKAERLVRSAELWERGADGEVATAMVLQGLPTGWVVLHDLHWPGRRFANIDHVVIGPPGVFVVDSKNWSGRIEVSNDVLRQNGRQREKAVAGAADSALALAEQLTRVDASRVHPVLCFVRDEQLTGWARDVMVCSTQNLVAMLTTRAPSFVPMRVTEIAAEVRAAGRRIRSDVPVATRPSRHRPTSYAPLPSAPRASAAGRSGRRRQRSAAGVLSLLLLAFAFHEQAADLLSRMMVPSIAEQADDSPAVGSPGPCAQVRLDYPKGVGRRGALDRVRPGDRPVKDFVTSTPMYNTYTGLASDPKIYDHDGDGIACEPRRKQR